VTTRPFPILGVGLRHCRLHLCNRRPTIGQAPGRALRKRAMLGLKAIQLFEQGAMNQPPHPPSERGAGVFGAFSNAFIGGDGPTRPRHPGDSKRNELGSYPILPIPRKRKIAGTPKKMRGSRSLVGKLTTLVVTNSRRRIVSLAGGGRRCRGATFGERYDGPKLTSATIARLLLGPARPAQLAPHCASDIALVEKKPARWPASLSKERTPILQAAR
jgi:hypothetical protein